MVRTGVSDDEGVLATSADVSSGASADTVVSAAGQKLKQGGTDAAQLNDANSDGAVLPRESINAHIHNLYVRQDFDECLKVYASAVEAVGLDPESGPLWGQYLAMLVAQAKAAAPEKAFSSEGLPGLPTGLVPTGVSSDAHIRRIFQLALSNPIAGHERLLRAYSAFEGSEFSKAFVTNDCN